MLLTIRLADEKAVPYLTYQEKARLIHENFPGEIVSQELDSVTGIVTFTLARTSALTDTQRDYLHLSDEAQLVDAFKTEDAPQAEPQPDNVRVLHDNDWQRRILVDDKYTYEARDVIALFDYEGGKTGVRLVERSEWNASTAISIDGDGMDALCTGWLQWKQDLKAAIAKYAAQTDSEHPF